VENGFVNLVAVVAFLILAISVIPATKISFNWRPCGSIPDNP
jgi:hypothetical protein